MSDWDDIDSDPKPNTVSYPNYNDKYQKSNNNDDGWGEDGQSQNRFSRQDTRSSDGISFEVGKQHVGMVIGRRGATIKDIEQRFNVTLKIGKEVKKKKQN